MRVLTLQRRKFEVCLMVRKWQILCSMILALTFAFPESAFSAVRKHSVSTKKVAHTTKKKSHKSSKKVASRKKTRVKTKVATRRWRTKVATSNMMWSAPMNTTPLSPTLSARMKANFQRGQAGRYTPQDMVRARVFSNAPLLGGIKPRTALVKNLIIHSTETAKVADAKTVVHSWNSGGLRHPGTQYLVDRDGKIYQTVDPKYATIHVNEKRTIGGITNDNSIGIEIVRTGKQKYTQVQLASLVQLVDYIQERFPIAKIYGHGQIQPSNRTDPVAFNWNLFSKNLAHINAASTQTAYREASREDNQG